MASPRNPPVIPRDADDIALTISGKDVHLTNLRKPFWRAHPQRLTAEYWIAKRPAGRVLVDYNQNAWGRTLASVYSPRPRPLASVSAPLTWEELADGAAIDDFRIDNVPARIAARGDLWAPVDVERGRFDLAPLLAQVA